MGFWTEDQVERLKQHWVAGLSCSAIGGRMGISRNAVIGKAHRLGLEERAPRNIAKEKRKQAWTPEMADRQRANRIRKRGEDMSAATLVPAPEYIGSLRIPFSDLRDFKYEHPNQCRYIADEPPGPDYVACGSETMSGESYCPHCRPLTVSQPRSLEERRVSMERGVRKHLRSIRREA